MALVRMLITPAAFHRAFFSLQTINRVSHCGGAAVLKPWKRQSENTGTYTALRNGVLINGETVYKGTFSKLFFQVEKFPKAVLGSFTSESVRNNEQLRHFTFTKSFFYFKDFSHCVPVIGR